MDPSEEVVQLLVEIRDTQQQLLDEYRNMAARGLEIQEEAVKRQAAIAAFYKRTVFTLALVLGGCLVVLLKSMLG